MITLSQQIELIDTLRSDLVIAERVQNYRQIITHNSELFQMEANSILSRQGDQCNATVLKLIELSKSGVKHGGNDIPSTNTSGEDVYTLTWLIGHYTITMIVNVVDDYSMHHSLKEITITTDSGESLQPNEIEDLESFINEFGERNHSYAGVETSHHYKESSITNPEDRLLISNYVRNAQAIRNLLKGDCQEEIESFNPDTIEWSSYTQPERLEKTEVVINRREHAIIETTSRYIVPNSTWKDLINMDDSERNSVIINSNEAECISKDIKVNETILTHEIQVDGYTQIT